MVQGVGKQPQICNTVVRKVQSWMNLKKADVSKSQEVLCMNRVGADWSVYCLIAYGDVMYFTWLRSKKKNNLQDSLTWVWSTHLTFLPGWLWTISICFTMWVVGNKFCQSFEGYRPSSFVWGGSTQSGNLKVKFVLLFGSGFLPVFVTAAAEIADSPKNMKNTLSLYNKFLGFHSEVLNSFFGVLKKLFSLILFFFFNGL